MITVDRDKNLEKCLKHLPNDIVEGIETVLQILQENPKDPRLKSHPVQNSNRGSHRRGSISIRYTRQYRVLYVPDNAFDTTQATVYWAGSHAQFDALTGMKS